MESGVDKPTAWSSSRPYQALVVDDEGGRHFFVWTRRPFIL